MKIEELKELGIDEKQLKILFALKDGPLNGPELEKTADLRQPEVSRALNSLKAKGYVKLLKEERRFKKGAPVKIWGLTKPFNEILKEIVGKKLVELDRKLRIALSTLFELGEPISGVDPEIIKAIRDDVIVIELKKTEKGYEEQYCSEQLKNCFPPPQKH